MKIIYVTFILATTMFFNTSSYAAGYTGAGQVQIMQSAYGGWLIRVSGANENPDGCAKANVLLSPSHAQYDELYSMILAAYSSGKEININVSDCAPSGHKIFNFIYTSWNL